MEIDIGNLFRLKKEYKANKDWIIRDITNVFEHCNDNYFETESNGNRNKTISIES